MPSVCLTKVLCRSEAKDLLGDDWVQRHRRIVQQHANAYQRAAWGKVKTLDLFSSLSFDGHHALRGVLWGLNVAMVFCRCSNTSVAKGYPPHQVVDWVRELVARLSLPAVAFPELFSKKGHITTHPQLTGSSYQDHTTWLKRTC